MEGMNKKVKRCTVIHRDGKEKKNILFIPHTFTTYKSLLAKPSVRETSYLLCVIQ